MEINNDTPNPRVAADIPQPAPMLAPEAVVGQLRALRGQIGEVTPLSVAERKALRSRAQTTNAVLQASINVIGASDKVSQAVDQPADAVRSLYDEANRWTAVEDELRTMLHGIAGANLVRRERLALIATRAYKLGTELARDPANALLLPHVEEIKRLRRTSRRKKAASAPQTGTSGTPKP
ncbi:MAG TPA: hypothetical protein VJZ76_00710 [Thermoanaerobaculia bacterium]|nr:hypothetical protein [Thermoanaerobaculia bacterium]